MLDVAAVFVLLGTVKAVEWFVAKIHIATRKMDGMVRAAERRIVGVELKRRKAKAEGDIDAEGGVIEDEGRAVGHGREPQTCVGVAGGEEANLV